MKERVGSYFEILYEDKIIIGDAISIRFLPCANLFNICCCAALYYYTSTTFVLSVAYRIAYCPDATPLVCGQQSWAINWVKDSYFLGSINHHSQIFKGVQLAQGIRENERSIGVERVPISS